VIEGQISHLKLKFDSKLLYKTSDFGMSYLKSAKRRTVVTLNSWLSFCTLMSENLCEGPTFLSNREPNNQVQIRPCLL